MSNRLFGLELIFEAHKNAVQSQSDAALVFLHWVLLQNGFRVLKDSADRGSGSELLPSGWNTPGVYSLRYTNSTDSHFLLKVLLVEGQVIANFSSATKDEAVSTFTKLLAEMVSDDFATYRDPASLRIQVEECLLKAPKDGSTSSARPETSTPQREPSSADDPLRVPSSADDPLRIPSSVRRYIPANPFALGGADLDPLGRGFGGGMVMDPRRPPNLRMPPGVPPGARFDPFFPSGANPPRHPRLPGEPDYDHLPPPGYDDMFM